MRNKRYFGGMGSLSRGSGAVKNVMLAFTPRRNTADLISAYTSSICTDTVSSLNFDVSQNNIKLS